VQKLEQLASPRAGPGPGLSIRVHDVVLRWGIPRDEGEAEDWEEKRGWKMKTKKPRRVQPPPAKVI
jgi:hypothetical protein